VKKAGGNRLLHRRIIVIFLLAIMLPGLIQAYLGLRYLKQEEKRQEQLVLRSFKVTLADAARKIEDDIHGNILKTFDALSAVTSSPDEISPSKLYQFLSEHDLLEEIFILDYKGRLLFPRSFRTQNRTGESQLMVSDVARPWLISGEESEARGRHDDAIDKYTIGLNRCTARPEELAFLVRIARCRLKTGDRNEAIRTFQRVIVLDSDRFYGEEIPFQVIASFQLAQIFDQAGRPGESIKVLLHLYENMLARFDRFMQKQFLFYLSEVNTKLQDHYEQAGSEERATLQKLNEVEEKYMQEPTRGEYLKAEIIPSIEIALLTKSESNIVRYTSVDHVADSMMLIAFMDLGYQSRSIRVIGARLSRSQVLSSVLGSLEGIDLGENLHVALCSEKNGPLIQGKADFLPIAEESLFLLAGTMQGYKIALTGSEGTSMKGFISKSVTIYYALILAIIVVIALGVFFIFHDISREQEFMRMKSEFISNVTHEIKTPIATIRSLAENVNEGWITSQEKQQDYFHLIARESERLGHLVENTLDFSRIESGSKRYHMEPISLQEVVEKTLERFRFITEGQGIAISCDFTKNLPPVCADKGAIGQVLLNLMDNAAKYSVGEKFIKLVSKVDGDYVSIAVSDKGIGIDKKDLPRIFDKFYRSESGTGKHITGSGIGLTLVKEIVEAHGGDVTVESERDKGSTFTVRIPFNQNK
jgi:signal transduction histidine kinase